MAGTTSTKTTNRRPRTKVDPNETPDLKFTRLANIRGAKLVHLMKLLKNLGTSYAYKMDASLAQKWLTEFQDSFNDLRNSWESSLTKNSKKDSSDESGSKVEENK